MHRILWDDTFAYLLQRMSSSLQSLELGSHPREDIPPIFPDYTKLPLLPHLQDLLLGPFPVLHFPPNTMDHDPLPWIMKFLSGISTDASLKRVHLRLYTFGGSITVFPFYNLGWKHLDRQLRLLTQLDHLEMELSCFHRPSSQFVATFRAFLEHQFPSFAEAGNLHVVSGRDSWFRG
ncbi:hypothetical protein BD779DRAFT_943966 [Infundibulicybe gibba]|nr:hypothetical protein BD779DRAFT_943966 [Infundibulicybe gibba]